MRGARRVEGYLAVEELVRLKVIGHAVKVGEGDARPVKAELNRPEGKPARVIHTYVAYARELLLFYGGYDFSALNQRGSRVPLLSRNSEYIHLHNPFDPTSSRDKYH